MHRMRYTVLMDLSIFTRFRDEVDVDPKVVAAGVAYFEVQNS